MTEASRLRLMASARQGGLRSEVGSQRTEGSRQGAAISTRHRELSTRHHGTTRGRGETARRRRGENGRKLEEFYLDCFSPGFWLLTPNAFFAMGLALCALLSTGIRNE
jgi:hypothetical protein